MKKKPKIIFIDTEFTGEHAATTLVSLGIVTLDGDELYLTFDDYDHKQVTDWLQENVLANIDKSQSVSSSEGYLLMNRFLSDYSDAFPIFVVSAGLAQDSVLFMELFKYGCPNPEHFHSLHHLPDYLKHNAFIDLNTLFRAAGKVPPSDRAAFAGMAGMSAHDALDDARVVRACFMKLYRTEAGQALVCSLSR